MHICIMYFVAHMLLLLFKDQATVASEVSNVHFIYYYISIAKFDEVPACSVLTHPSLSEQASLLPFLSSNPILNVLLYPAVVLCSSL